MRIIAGKFKGKKLMLPVDKKTRPLRNLVKESIFNLLDHSNKFKAKIEDSKILDLFAGSGSFGLECISRNAKSVSFLESYPEALKILKKNISKFKNFKNYKIIEQNCFDFFKTNQILDEKYDIIFCDPPYKELRINIVINKIIEDKLLKPNGIIIIHRHKKDTINITKKMRVLDTRNYGISKIIIGF
tara:strand:+ start:15 stop:575 length:561 start_codon:yes stop_codon:yes gene_type:complete